MVYCVVCRVHGPLRLAGIQEEYTDWIEIQKEMKETLLYGILQQVFLAPLHTSPYSFVEEHESRLEDSVCTGNFRCDAQVLRNEDRHGEGVANGEETPDYCFGKRSSHVVTPSCTASLALIHEAFTKEHGECLAEKVSTDHFECNFYTSRELEGCRKGHTPGNNSPYE